jgi:O-acetylhomoserine/O-acetylserine sulfhydrylase-like pyridoxal-dependent enzyme
VLNLARAGDNLVSSQTLYGGTYNLFAFEDLDQALGERDSSVKARPAAALAAS